MERVEIRIGRDLFEVRLQDHLAPNTCAKFRSLLPWSNRLIHVQWSGEGCWIPLGDARLNLPFENATRHPKPGEVILFDGAVSETEILIAYGAVSFASKAGPLAGDPFLSISDKLERLAEIGREILWGGTREISFKLCS